jgi:hypothetical protein
MSGNSVSKVSAVFAVSLKNGGIAFDINVTVPVPTLLDQPDVCRYSDQAASDRCIRRPTGFCHPMRRFKRAQNSGMRTTLEDLAEYHNGAAFKPADWGTKGTPIIRIQILLTTRRH